MLRALWLKDLRANLVVFASLWLVILAAVCLSLSLKADWRVGVVTLFAMFAPIVTAPVTTLTLLTTDKGLGTEVFFGSLPISRVRAWLTRWALIGLHLLVILALTLLLTWWFVRIYTQINDNPAVRPTLEWELMAMFISFSWKAALFIGLIAFACAALSSSQRLAWLWLIALVLTLCFSFGVINGATDFGIFNERLPTPLLDWLLQAELLGTAAVVAFASLYHAVLRAPLEAGARLRASITTAALGLLLISAAAAAIHSLCNRVTPNDILHVQRAEFSPDGKRLLLETWVEKWRRVGHSRLWLYDVARQKFKYLGRGTCAQWVKEQPNCVHLRLPRWLGTPTVNEEAVVDVQSGHIRRFRLPASVLEELRYNRLAKVQIHPDSGRMILQTSPPGGYGVLGEEAKLQATQFFISSSNDLRIPLRTADGNGLNGFVAWRRGGAGAFMMFRPDVLFNSSSVGLRRFGGVELWHVSLPEGNASCLSPEAEKVMTWSNLEAPNGEWVYLVVWRSAQEDAPGELRLTRYDGSDSRTVEKQLRPLITAPNWSPSGNRLTYVTEGEEEGLWRLHCYDVASKKHLTITSFDPHSEMFPTQSWHIPAGTWPIEESKLKLGSVCSIDAIAWDDEEERLAIGVRESAVVQKERIREGHLFRRVTLSLLVADWRQRTCRHVAVLEDSEWDEWELVADRRGRMQREQPTVMALAWDEDGRIVCVKDDGQIGRVSLPPK